MAARISTAAGTPLVAATGNLAAASGTATLSHNSANAQEMVYCSGFEVTGSGATAASVISITVTGVRGGTLTYTVAVPAGVTAGVTPLIVEFDPPIPATDTATDIVLNLPSFGTGNTNAAGVIHGYRM